MNLDLSKFRKITEDHHSATMQHPDGHQIKISKKILSPKMQADISKLPLHLDEGGSVPGPTPDEQMDQKSQYTPSFQEPQQQQPTTVINIAGQGPQAPTPMPNMPPPQTAPQNMGVHQESQQPQFPEAKPVQMAQPAQQPFQAAQSALGNNSNSMGQSDPYGSNAYTAVSKEGLQNQLAGIQGEASGQAQINQARAKVLDQGVQQQQKLMNDYQSTHQNLQNEYHNFISDYQKQHIDPQHYLNSQSTGQNISTAIGLILGGMGGGLTHQGNAALDFLNKQIDRDIEAQKGNMDQKKNLLAANMQQFHNERDAVDMTRAMQAGIISNKLEEAALKSGNPLLQARARQAAGQLELQNNQLFSQMAIRQTLQNGQGQGTSAMNPATNIRLNGMIGMMNPSQQAEAEKQLQTAENMGRQRDNLLNAFDVVNDNNTVGNRIAHLGFTPAKTAAARDPLLAQLVKDSEGRITPTDIDLMKPLFPTPGDAPSTIAFKKQKMAQFVDEKMHFPLLDAYGINPYGKRMHTQQGQSKVTEGPPVGLQ